jgi:hypothetical protein
MISRAFTPLPRQPVIGVPVEFGTNAWRAANVPRERIGTSFHETFALNIPAVVSVLRVSDEHDGDVDPDTIRSETNLGPNYVKAMPLYARGCGLLEMGSFQLTPFGRLALDKDPNLTRVETLWLMHYHLSAPHGPGPGFWNNLIATTVRIGQPLRRSEVATAIGKYTRETANRSLSIRVLESTATVFLGTYAKSDALGKLGLVAPTEEAQGSYEVTQPDAPPLWALACALSDYWEALGHGASELLLKDLGNQNGFAGLFFMGPGMLGAFLSELQSAGVVGIKRDAPPFVVTRLWRDGAELRERLYG